MLNEGCGVLLHGKKIRISVPEKVLHFTDWDSLAAISSVVRAELNACGCEWARFKILCLDCCVKKGLVW